MKYHLFMPSNVEIKAVLHDLSAVESIVASLADSGPQIIQQEDVFFHCDGARLKLRIFSANAGELIRYERSNTADVRRSHYLIARTSDPRALLEILTASLGQVGVVKKTRTLYLIGQTRVHLDQVEGLGDYLELEVVLRANQSEAEGKVIAGNLLAKFHIDKSDLIGEAYVDLLRAKSSGGSSR